MKQGDRWARALDAVVILLAVALTTIPAAFALGVAVLVFRWVTGA